MTQAQRPTRVPWLRLVQIVCTLGLGVVLARSIDWASFGASLASLRWGFVALAALFLLAAHALNVVRWRGLLPPGAIAPGTLAAYYGAGLFCNNFLPTGIGGDGVRAALAARHVALPPALLSVALDRGVGLAGLGLFLLPALWFGLPAGLGDRLALPALPSQWLWVLAVIAIGAALGGAGALLYGRGQQLRGLLTRVAGSEQVPATARRGVRGWAALLLNTYALSVCSNLGTIAAHWAILAALGISVSPGAAIWLVLAGSLSMLLPISINSLGVLESVFIVVLAAYAVPAPTALAVALLARALSTLYSLAGGALSLRTGGWAVKEPTAKLLN